MTATLEIRDQGNTVTVGKKSLACHHDQNNLVSWEELDLVLGLPLPYAPLGLTSTWVKGEDHRT